ncbi:ABC transporter ATP-binding protein [Nocardiopsis sp. CC223A]|uniref:ABC transporter ATP-binding protein n=1 Tax=Nocardiopsis sp. CC223A TaxID=3044051 RepID=UPI00278C2793|nr:ABC transporter ATP-binding protein [Nocardiopsis sp. CC223A]
MSAAEHGPDDVLTVRGLRMEAGPPGSPVPLLDGVDLRVGRGETVGLVGESGSGKSLTARAALGLFPAGARVSGAVTAAGTEVIGADRAALRGLRRHRVSMVFQDPRAAVNPVRRVGDHLTEALRARGVPRREARDRALDLLERVGIRDPRTAVRRFPHEFSGGMLQRVVIAGALSTGPDLILADEPTTALDVTTQAEVIALLDSLRRERGTGMLFVTHDLDLAAAICDRVHVMYAGRIVEETTGAELLSAPAHPYTRALVAASPSLHGDRGAPVPVAGRPRSLAEAPSGCSFRDRCPAADDACAAAVPAVRRHGGAAVACLRPAAVAL